LVYPKHLWNTGSPGHFARKRASHFAADDSGVCANGALHSWRDTVPDYAALHSGFGTEKTRQQQYDTITVPIPTLKIWNQDIGASQNCTGCSRESDDAFDPPIGARGLDWGFVTALVPRSRPHLFSGT
jgi:hypothetical protein